MSKELEDVLNRLDRLESIEAIRQLATVYAVACDEHDMTRLMSLFTADAVFDSPTKTMVAEGQEQIEKMFVDLFKIRGPAFHWTHDKNITLDRNDCNKASGIIYSHAETTPNNVISLAAMKYLDEYERHDGTWQFSRREIHFLYYVPFSNYSRGLNNRLRVWVGDKAYPGDYPESLPAWQEYVSKYLSS